VDALTSHLERLDREENGAAATTKVEQQTGGNLAQYDDTWHIVREGETVPASATLSDCRLDASTSEYADDDACLPCGGPQAWMSHSLISFDYRVAEVPRGKLLDPACDALIFGHLPFGSPERQAAEGRAQRRLVIIDETVDDLYGAKVRAYFEARGVVHEIMRLPMVEEEKSIENTLKVCKKMKEFNIDRRTEPVIAIGGGVCLDVVGLAASLFRRRTPYIRVPTTALAYVDASVGAKNGCNFCGSKNRLGTYVPPAAALLDSSFFKTQEAREVSNSLGEMAKMSLMKSKELFHLLKDHAPRLIDERFEPRDATDEVPERVLRLSIETMLEELTPNLWEHSLDRLVDFGHAVGQNLEMAALGTDHELKHGEAVACDMAYMSVLSNVLGKITAEERDSILSMLRTCQVPVYSPIMTRELFREGMKDRVQNSMGQRLPLPCGIGKGCIVNDVSDAEFERAFVLWEELCKQ
jgi:3-dehydroquinate synthase